MQLLGMCKRSMARLELGSHWLEGKKKWRCGTWRVPRHPSGSRGMPARVSRWSFGKVERSAAIWLRAASPLEILGDCVGGNLVEGGVPPGDFGG